MLAFAAVMAVGCGGDVRDDSLMEEAKATARAGGTNSSTIVDPHLIYPGQVLRLPPSR